MYCKIIRNGVGHVVAGILVSPLALGFAGAVRACVHKAITNAELKVNAPTLIAAHNGRNTTPLPNELLSKR